MRNPTITTIATYGVLALAGAAPVALPEQLPIAGASAASGMGPAVPEPALECSSLTDNKAATERSSLDPANTRTVVH